MTQEWHHFDVFPNDDMYTHRHFMLRIGDEALLISEFLRLCRPWTCTSAGRVETQALMDVNCSTSSWHAVRAAWHTAGHCGLIKQQMWSCLKKTNIHPAGTTSPRPPLLALSTNACKKFEIHSIDFTLLKIKVPVRTKKGLWCHREPVKFTLTLILKWSTYICTILIISLSPSANTVNISSFCILKTFCFPTLT